MAKICFRPVSPESRLSVSGRVRMNVHVTPSGMFSPRHLAWALDVMGAGRILFSTDHPYVPLPDGGASRFLEEAPLSDADRSRIAHGNRDRLCARRTSSEDMA